MLARLAPQTANALLSLGVEQRVPAGRVLIREGSTESHVVIIRRGLTKVTAEMADGRSALLSIRVAGDILGEMSALSGSPRSATVTMCGSGLVRFVHRRDFTPFLNDFPGAAVELATMVGERLRWSNRRRIDFTSYPLKTRLARVLAELAELYGQERRHGALEIGVRLTQPELATMCGAAEITVHKALRDMRRSHLISTRYGRITVWNLPELRGSADMAPDQRRPDAY
nr:Crp/Fnr family transcriptional regulator [Actinoplanes friuliensis]